MVIQHNLTAMYGDMVLKNTSYQLENTTKRMSSGYKINSASDNAADLAISEKMRGQIRGLWRADNNIEEGISYVKTVDGVLDEVTNIVQRMRELTVQALNDTNTDDDKMQIQQEIEQLKYEITKISRQTEYNTEKVFTSNEKIWCKLEGGKEWDMDTIHKVTVPDNTLTITLPESYGSSEITVTVSEGSYTTYELIETIDELLEEQAPKGTYFLIEYEDGGTINLVFEGGSDIECVSGGLSYLFFDTYGGSGVGDLIGTTNFEDAFPLKIVAGYNDELTFSVDPLDGSSLYTVSIRLDAGEYTRDEVIDAINQKLSEAGHSEVQAVAYGTNNVELTAGTSLITGLKGNMFQIDTGSKVYDSVFYDNVKYGSVSNTTGSIKGKAYYSSSAKVSITSANNELKIKGENDTEYTSITIPEGEYTMAELAKVLNDKLKEASGSDSPKWEFTAKTTYLSAGSTVGTSGTYYYLSLSSADTGVGSSIEIDTTSSAYDTLFRVTNSKSVTAPDKVSGTDPYILGQKTINATVSSPFTLTAAGETICLEVDGTKATLTLSESSYTSLGDLLDDINSQIENSSLSGRIKAQSSSNRIQIVAASSDVSSIEFQSNPGTAYSDLFVGVTYSAKSYSKTSTGTTTKQQGSTAYVETPASLTLSYAVKSEPIVVDSTNNTFKFTLNGASKSITLTEGTYTASSLIEELNKQFTSGGIGLTASLSGGKITFTTTETGENSSLYISSSNNPAMKVLMEPNVTTNYPIIKSLEPAYILGKTIIDSSNPVEIDTSNNVLNVTYRDSNGSTSASLTVTSGTYSSAAALATELNSQIQKSDLNGLVTAEAVDGVIKLVTVEKGSAVSFSSVSGGFYDSVLCGVTTSSVTNNPSITKGSTTYTESYVVGRADINNNSVEIKKGVNDVLSIDFTYPDSDGNSITVTLETTIPAGIYTGEEIARLLTEGTMDSDGMDSFNEKLKEIGITEFTITAAIGAHDTGVVGADDANALSFTLNRVDSTKPLNTGTYILDGVSGSAAYSVFYKTSGLPIPAYVTGSKDISDGVVITEENNTIGFTVDGQEYIYTISEGEYTAEEWVEMMNELIDAGDDNGNIALVETVLEDGKWKIQYKNYGSHTISRVTGTAKQDVFYGNSYGEENMGLRIQVGANGGQELQLNKIALSTALLKLDGIDVTTHSHAEFALKHMDYAINFINSKRSDYGAKQNRLEAAERLVENMGENLQSAESGIRDANIADEAMNYTTASILAQAGQSILAQANRVARNEVEKLLEVSL